MGRLIKPSILFLAIATLSGCDRDEPGKTDSRDRTPMLIHWADNIIVPSYDSFRAKMEVLQGAADAFAEAPSQESLLRLRSAWVEAYSSWQTVELFEVGPAERYTLRNFFNIYPANVEAITVNIGDPSANLDVPSAYASQGFPALDYLINGVADSNESIVAFYTSADQGAARIAYLAKLVTRMVSLLDNVIQEWSAYRDVFVSQTGLDIGSSTGLLVNAYVLHYERFIRSGKFGIPSGAMTTSGGTPYPEKVEAFYKRDISLALAKTAHQAVIDFFAGKDPATGEYGPSFRSYLDALEAKDAASGTLLSDIILQQLAEAQASMEPLSESLYQQVLENNGAMIAVFMEMQAATRMLKVDLTSAMGITITYTDNDGD